MKEYPIPLIELNEAIEKGRFESLRYSCKIISRGHLHYIKARNSITKRTEYWIYNDRNGDYNIEEVDYIGTRD